MNLAAVIGGHADDQIALIDGDDRIDFGTLRGRVAAMQADLAERGVGVDSAVALATGNDVAFVVSTARGARSRRHRDAAQPGQSDQ